MNQAAPAPTTLMLASCNTLNLASPGRPFDPNEEPLTADAYARKIAWLGGMLRRAPKKGATSTARVALVTRWPMVQTVSRTQFEPAQVAPLPERGGHRAFERSVLESDHALVRALVLLR